jgi:hypothetical protein
MGCFRNTRLALITAASITASRIGEAELGTTRRTGSHKPVIRPAATISTVTFLSTLNAKVLGSFIPQAT